MSTKDSPGQPTAPDRAPGWVSEDDADLLATLEQDEALALLATSLRPEQPSPRLRASLLEAVAKDSQTTSLQAATATSPQARQRPQHGHAAPSAQSPGTAGAQVIALRPSRRWLGSALRVAASVAILGVGVGIGRWSAMDAMESMESTAHFAHLNEAQDVQRVVDTMPDGHIATLTWSQDMSMTALTLPAEMMEAANGTSLQVWLRKGGQVKSLGLYDPGSGSGFTFLDLMPEADEQVFITQEPKGGSAQPTGQALVTFDVRSDGTTTRKPQGQPTGDSQA